MLTHFGLACEMPAVANDLDTPDGVPLLPSYLVPWFVKSKRPTSLETDGWPSHADERQVREHKITIMKSIFKVPSTSYPDSLFSLLEVS